MPLLFRSRRLCMIVFLIIMIVISLVTVSWALTNVFEKRYVVKYFRFGVFITYHRPSIFFNNPSVRITIKNITDSIICGNVSASLHI